MPGPEVYLSYVAAQTERIHVGSAIFNITPKVNHPARVAETVALLDLALPCQDILDRPDDDGRETRAERIARLREARLRRCAT